MRNKERYNRVNDMTKMTTHYLICQFWVLPIQQQIKIWCQNYGQMGIQAPVGIEKNEGKEEIARYEQFLLFPQFFFKS